MSKQLHKNFTDNQVKSLLKSYIDKEIKLNYILQMLSIRRSRFFELLAKYRKDPYNFSIQHKRKTINRKIDPDIEKNIVKELNTEKDLIKNKDVPIKYYNYSFIKDILEQKYNQKVSLPTIIDRAKRNNFYLLRPKRKAHDREVITNYPGELIQHDSSHHQFAPYAEKWYLITSIDDYNRLILYASLVERETTWEHILALENVLLKYGFPLAYYVDSHSIFRFVQGRDSFWRNHYKLTDEANPQWKQVLDDCRVKVTYALSPQAKGKIERPYRWIQDRLVRTCCYRENIRNIKKAQLTLNNLVQKYNYRIVHSTTGKIPYFRFQRAIREKRTLFSKFTISPPFKSTKDIFCLRVDRMVNSYRKVSINNLELKVPGAPLHERIQLRIIPDRESSVSEVRFWHEDELLGMQKVKNSELNLVHF